MISRFLESNRSQILYCALGFYTSIITMIRIDNDWHFDSDIGNRHEYLNFGFFLIEVRNDILIVI